jgi:hypothetical protein
MPPAKPSAHRLAECNRNTDNFGQRADSLAAILVCASQTPRVSIAVKRTALATQPLEQSELKRFSDWNDGQPETELTFKFYRQATNKIVG